MNSEIKETKNILQNISDQIHSWVKINIPDGFVLASQIVSKFVLLILFFIIIDLLLKIVFKVIYLPIKSKSENPIIRTIIKGKIPNSIANFISIAIVREMIYPVFYRHPKSYDLLETIFKLMFVLVLAILYFRILKAIENYYLYKGINYKLTGIRAVTQSLKIVGYIVFGFIAVSIFFHIDTSAIVGSLGAITAIILLVFRDTILGFVTGIHVSTSKNIKAGDWVGIPKYQIEGMIQEINLMTTKILNFDKTISTIPTYDLVSTEVKNMQVMWEGNRRRMKKSIIFNVKSFKFLSEEDLTRLSKVNLIREYITRKQQEIHEEKQTLENKDEVINGRQLTNIGVFRIYALNYLKQNKKIDHDNLVMVRQLEITPQGLPLEIYCFTTESSFEKFEEIQADVFDHLMVAARIFDLEVMQTYFKN